MTIADDFAEINKRQRELFLEKWPPITKALEMCLCPNCCGSGEETRFMMCPMCNGKGVIQVQTEEVEIKF